MINIVEFLSGLNGKAYKFLAPSTSATSTVINNAALIEFTRQSGQSVTAVTNGLGQCVGYTATNVALVSNAESTAIGTVIDFTSRQVVANPELLATTPVVGSGTVAAGATVTEVTATSTTTAMIGTTVASVGACVLAAIGGYALGKTVGEYLAEKYPEFWVDTCGKALYEAGCTLASGVNSVITYITPEGQTLVPKKTSEIIQSELRKIDALASGDRPFPDEGYVEIGHMTARYENGNVFDTYYFGRGGTSDYVLVPSSSHGRINDSGVPSWVFYGILYTKESKNVDRNSGDVYALTYRSDIPDISRANITSITSNPNTMVSRSLILNLPIIPDMAAYNRLIETGKYDPDSIVEMPDGYYIPPKIDPTVSPAPVKIPQPKIKPENAPDDDDEQAIPVPSPQEVPTIVPNEVFDPKVNPVNIIEPVVINPNPYPLPQPTLHVPEPAEIPPKKPNPPKPVVIPNMVASALSRVYNPTQVQLDGLGEYMWSSSRLEDLLKVFQSPADGIVSLHAIYGTPSIGPEYEIKLGYLSTGVNAPVVTSQFVVVNCGEISINEKYKNATDYAPYTTIQIYLPFIGIQSLNPFDIIGSKIKCTYKIDVYTGACIAQLNAEREGLNGVIYEFAGNCGYQIPLTSGNYMQALANVIGGTIGGALVGGGGGAALGAGSALLHSNVDVARSGNLSANAGILGTREPYFIITRSIPRDALNYSKYYGYPANKTIYLSDCTGFTRVKDIILHTSGTQEERDEIMTLLKHGIYI